MGIRSKELRSKGIEWKTVVHSSALTLHVLSLCFGLFYSIWLFQTSDHIGIPRDESIYMYAADRFSGWWTASYNQWTDAFSESALQKGFKFNREHPMIMKMLFGWSHHYLHRKWKVIQNPITAYRLPSFILSGLSVYLTSFLTFTLIGYGAGFLAFLTLLGLPRFYFHAHLACFDSPAVFFWLLTSVAYLKALSSRRWIVMVGLCFGIGCGVKLNLFFLPFLLLGLSIWHCIKIKRNSKVSVNESSVFKHVIRNYIWIALSFSILGFLVFWSHWPWLYSKLVPRLNEYLAFHANHVHYPVDYLGTLYYRPPFPFEFPFRFTLYTVPIATLLLSGVGFLYLIARILFPAYFTPLLSKTSPSISSAPLNLPVEYPLDLFLLAQFLFPFLVIAWPNTPIFGGTKHWMASLPFMAILVGLGGQIIVDLFKKQGKKTLRRSRQRDSLIIWCLLIMCFIPGIRATIQYGAHGPAWYNQIAGGIQGAAEKRMPRNFWGYSSRDLLPYLNRVASKGEKVFWHNATGAAVYRYQSAKWLRSDLHNSGDWTYPYAHYGIYHDQREKRLEELDLWWSFGTPFPKDGVFLDGVQQIGLYQRDPFLPIDQQE